VSGATVPLSARDNLPGLLILVALIGGQADICYCVTAGRVSDLWILAAMTQNDRLVYTSTHAAILSFMFISSSASSSRNSTTADSISLIRFSSRSNRKQAYCNSSGKRSSKLTKSTHSSSAHAIWASICHSYCASCLPDW